MAMPIPKPPSKPAPKPVAKTDFFKGGVSTKKMKWQMIQEAKAGKIVIPGTGGQKMTEKQVKDVFERKLSYGKVKTHLDNRSEAIRVLKRMRAEDKGKPSRERRVFEQRWNLKSGKDY